MSANTNRSSISKVAKTAEEQNETRRDKKRKQRTNGGRNGAAVVGYQAGLEQDRINDQGVRMLDILERTMRSSGSVQTELLTTATVTYVDAFTALAQSGGPLNRHRAAMKKALEPLNGGLKKYAQRELSSAFNKSAS